jgi:zinc transport system permease protein
MSSIRCQFDCPMKCRHTAFRAVRLAVILGAAILTAGSARDLWGQDRKQPASESSLDRAVRELDSSDSTSGLVPNTTSSDSASAGQAAADKTEPNAIESFFTSWTLFHNSYLVGWLVGLLLSLVGVIVVARDQVFIGAAVSQASTLGIALALCASGVFPLHSEDSLLPHSALWICCDSLQVTMAVAFSVLAALVTSRADRSKRESHEAITGWVFLVSASLSVLVVAHSPHGLEEVNRIHSSSIIGATATDVVLFTVFLLLTIVLLLSAGQRLLLFIMDPSMAAAVGIKVGRWAVFESLWLGLVVGLSIRATGMLFTFGSLVLPALVAKNVCREVRPMFFVAPLVALATNTVGFVLANGYDFPPAQMNVAILCLLLLMVWGFRRLRGIRAQ